MKPPVTRISRVISTGTIAIVCLLALPLDAQAKGPKHKNGKSEHSKGKKSGHKNDHDYAHDDNGRRAYIARPRSIFTLSFGNGYRGQGYYYGPPNSPYYYESPDTRYYSNREAAPREYYENQSYGRSDNSSVQRELARRGYYEGSIDGRIGPQSGRSIARYQRDQGLLETGTITSSLLQSLGLR
ncbi:MAG: hypothetical protein RLZZ214_2448 [Verrucomicrobiota bacterium]